MDEGCLLTDACIGDSMDREPAVLSHYFDRCCVHHGHLDIWTGILHIHPICPDVKTSELGEIGAGKEHNLKLISVTFLKIRYEMLIRSGGK